MNKPTNQGGESPSTFISECLDYYGEGGTYDIRANSEEIKKALEIRLNDKKGVLREFSKPLSEIEFDGGSVDREMIRDIVLTLRGEKPWETIFSSMPYGERSSEQIKYENG
jgi:hypothetical protein